MSRRHGLARSARFFEKSREGSGVEWSGVEWRREEQRRGGGGGGGEVKLIRREGLVDRESTKGWRDRCR